MLFKLIVRAVFGMLGLWLAATFVPGVVFTDGGSLILSALLLGIVNAFVRPIVVVLTLPITVLTLGLFLLIVNAAMIGLVVWALPGFELHGVLAGVLAAVLTGLASWIGGLLLHDQQRR